jgi:hypoxia up-regulated 1
MLQDSLDQTKNLIKVLKQSTAKASEEAAKASAEPSSSAAPLDDLDKLEEDAEFSSSTTTTSDVPTPSPVLFTEEELEGLTNSYEDIEKWLEGKLEEQQKLKPFEDPVLSVKEIEGKLKDMNNLLMKTLQKQMKQQIPPKAKSTKSSSKKTTSASSSTSTTTAESSSSTEAAKESKHDEL